MLKYIVIGMRPRQWVKNVFVFAALVFTYNMSDIAKWRRSLLAFALFCGLSGAVYLINDIKDREADREHPTKSKRPIAAGRLQTSSALAAAAVLIPVCLFFAFWLSPGLGFTSLAYVVLNVAYSLLLKHIVVLDVISVATGYVLRVLGGGASIQVVSTPWSMSCTFFLALFISLGRRRAEAASLSNPGEHRRILEQYPLTYLDNLLSLAGALTIMTYSLFTFVSGKDIHLMVTIPFVTYGVLRYSYLIHVKGSGGSPETLLVKDRPLLVNCLLWLAVSVVILYAGPL